MDELPERLPSSFRAQAERFMHDALREADAAGRAGGLATYHGGFCADESATVTGRFGLRLE
jgi:hypothetical protein